MGLFKLVQYPKHRRRRKKLKTDISAFALQESIISHMKDGKYLEAMRQIKEIWDLKTSPWTYSCSIINYIECLIRKGKFRDIDILEKEILRFYEKILDISPRRLFRAARDTMYISRRPVKATLLSFYSARLALGNKKKKPAIKQVQSSIELISVAVVTTIGQKYVNEYILSLVKELRNYINAISTNAKNDLKNECIENCEELIAKIKSQLENKKAEPRKQTRQSRKSVRTSRSSSLNDSKKRSIHRTKNFPSTSSESISQKYFDPTSERKSIENEGAIIGTDRVVEGSTLRIEV